MLSDFVYFSLHSFVTGVGHMSVLEHLLMVLLVVGSTPPGGSIELFLVLASVPQVT